MELANVMMLLLVHCDVVTSRRDLALALFEWIECWYNPSRRHSSIQMLSRIDYERAHSPAAAAA